MLSLKVSHDIYGLRAIYLSPLSDHAFFSKAVESRIALHAMPALKK
jgi:hypothetical protein